MSFGTVILGQSFWNSCFKIIEDSCYKIIAPKQKYIISN